MILLNLMSIRGQIKILLGNSFN
ncbi:hypothetical protein NC651_013874 [Populus alba x Populus x berolinensis]|nr:hypothetical protein NC651_013874 [Populus alba x Populus x berolinensis]